MMMVVVPITGFCCCFFSWNWKKNPFSFSDSDHHQYYFFFQWNNMNLKKSERKKITIWENGDVETNLNFFFAGTFFSFNSWKFSAGTDITTRSQKKKFRFSSSNVKFSFLIVFFWQFFSTFYNNLYKCQMLDFSLIGLSIIIIIIVLYWKLPFCTKRFNRYLITLQNDERKKERKRD